MHNICSKIPLKNNIKKGGINACNAAIFDIECSASDPCSFDCEEMSSRASAEVTATNVKDLKCAEDNGRNGRDRVRG